MLAHPLTIESFSPYGSIISPDEEVSKASTSSQSCEQAKAIKVLQVSQIQNPLGQDTPHWQFSHLFPEPHLKRHLRLDKEGVRVNYSVPVLEKHPYTSQTFLPIGAPRRDIAYLSVVALEDSRTKKPDLSTARAFLCRGNQVVTYGAGVWHTPMTVAGPNDYVDFAVLNYEVLEPGAPEKDLVQTFYSESELTVTLYAN